MNYTNTYSLKVERDYEEISEHGIVKGQNLDQHQLIEAIMRKGFREKGKIWWFGYETMGHWEIDDERYFMSYKAQSRLSEMTQDGRLEARGTKGKLKVYALKELLEKI